MFLRSKTGPAEFAFDRSAGKQHRLLLWRCGSWKDPTGVFAKDVALAAAKLKASGHKCPLTIAWQGWTQLESFSAWHNVEFATKGNGLACIFTCRSLVVNRDVAIAREPAPHLLRSPALAVVSGQQTHQKIAPIGLDRSRDGNAFGDDLQQPGPFVDPFPKRRPLPLLQQHQAHAPPIGGRRLDADQLLRWRVTGDLAMAVERQITTSR